MIKNITVSAISILGFSAVAGLGDLAYRYGYQRYQSGIMLVCILTLVIWV